MCKEADFKLIQPANCRVRVTSHSVRQFQLRFPTRPSPLRPVFLMKNLFRESYFLYMKPGDLAVFGNGFWEFLTDELGDGRSLVIVTCWNRASDKGLVRREYDKLRAFRHRRERVQLADLDTLAFAC